MLSAVRLCVFLLLASNTFAEIQNRKWWNNSIFYQIYPRSLYDSDGDGIGDLKGITTKLDYFAKTGINAIWLSPIYPSPQVDFGYDISNFVDIDPIYGTLQDFRDLLQRAKELGLKVVLDLVPNHTSDKHEWFQKALQGDEKYKNYYIWAKDTTNGTEPPNNWISVFGGSAWKYVPELGEWYLHQFEYRQPDLNFYNPDVREELLNVLKFWLNLGIDGFRIDSAAFLCEDPNLRNEPRSGALVESGDYDSLIHIYTMDLDATYELLGTWRQFVDSYADKNNLDEKMMVIEAYTSFEKTMKYYDYNLLPFNFEFIRNITSQSTAQDYKQKLDLWMNTMPKGEVANWVLGNHDNPRVASRFPGRLDQMTMLSMILPGLAVTYNGDEIGMVDKRDISWEDTQDPQACIAGITHYATVSRDPERTPFQWNASRNAGFSTANSTWLPVNQNYRELNLANQQKVKRSHYKNYKALLQLHRNEPALTKGSYRSFITNDNKVFGVIRNSRKRYVLLLINFSDDENQVVNLCNENLPLFLEVAVASLNSGVHEKSLTFSKKIHLPAGAAIVYKAKNLF